MNDFIIEGYYYIDDGYRAVAVHESTGEHVFIDIMITPDGDLDWRCEGEYRGEPMDAVRSAVEYLCSISRIDYNISDEIWEEVQ